MDIVDHSSQVKNTADKLLKETNLVEILSEFGIVFIGGSYKYDLMWDPDIDIVVLCDDPKKASKEALQKFIDLRLFQKYEYGDFAKFKRENRPESYIMNLRLPYADQKWEIETWFFDKMPQSQIETDNLIKAKLNKKNRITILEMKKKRDESGNTKHQISSTEIYQKVLIDGITNFEDLIK